jgi:hypothetical protein
VLHPGPLVTVPISPRQKSNHDRYLFIVSALIILPQAN